MPIGTAGLALARARAAVAVPRLAVGAGRPMRASRVQGPAPDKSLDRTLKNSLQLPCSPRIVFLTCDSCRPSESESQTAVDSPRRPTGEMLVNLTISGHHLEVTPALRDYVASKLDRITRHFDQVMDIRVLLTVEKQKEKERRQRAECLIHVKGNDLFAESSHADLYAALDDLVDKLDRQVGRHKTRMQEHSHETPKRLM